MRRPSNDNTKRIIVVAFLVCFFIVSLLSEAYIITHTNHTHDRDGVGGTCTTCIQMQNAENVLKQFSTASIVVTFSLAGLLAISIIYMAISSNIAIPTLVTQKIRINS